MSRSGSTPRAGARALGMTGRHTRSAHRTARLQEPRSDRSITLGHEPSLRLTRPSRLICAARREDKAVSTARRFGVLSAPDGRSLPSRTFGGPALHGRIGMRLLAYSLLLGRTHCGNAARLGGEGGGRQVFRWRVMLRPPAGTAVACAVPPCTAAIDETRARPSPKPSWRVRSSSRVNGRNSRPTWPGGMTWPVLTTRTRDAPLSVVVVEMVTVPPGML